LTEINEIKNIRAVLFDVDDTLFDRKGAQPLVLEIIVKKLPEIFRKMEMEKITAAFTESDVITTRDFESGAPSEGLRDIRSRLFLRLLGIDEDYAETITEMYVREYPAVKAPVPGSRDTVKELGRSYKTGIVSNGFPDVQYTKLETMGLRQKFSCIVLSEEIGIRKPDPAIFTRAAALLGIEAEECLYVGDSYTNDVIGAAGAGMKTCWFKRNSTGLEGDSLKADLVINDLAKLATILK
jgi:putative hydrolase of the HAD superfamily